jgi:uncharacterized membrane protein YdjX (TVP38/TMEM64 family)
VDDFSKRQRIPAGDLTEAARRALDGARKFAKAGHGFPFCLYQREDTVFWPGCALAANRPDLVRRIRKILSRELAQPVGLVLDCCFEPVQGLGDGETALAGLRESALRLRKRGVRRVITGCPNCQKLLAEHLGLECLFVLEALPPGLFEKQANGPVYLHHPCPTARWGAIRERAAASASPAPALCCGNGGGLSSLDPAQADRFLEKIRKEARGRTIVTYCMGCRNRFLAGGMEANHLLERLPGMKPRPAMPSPAAQWINRFLLAGRERILSKKFLAGLAVVILIAGGAAIQQQQLLSAEALLTLLGSHPVLAPLIFLGVYAAAPTLFLPAIPLTLAAGFLWGPFWGVVLALIGATLGACPPFFLARHLFQDAIRTKVTPERWTWFQDRVARHGWKAVAFTRLVPLFPFNLLNYLFGLTPIPFMPYLAATALFMLPGTIAFTAFGSSLGELILRGNVRGLLIGLAIAAAAFALPLALRPLFRGISGARPDDQKQPQKDPEEQGDS